MARTRVTKLSSASTRSAASRATSLPPRPMATPIAAATSAGASLTPSPVTATIWPAPAAARPVDVDLALRPGARHDAALRRPQRQLLVAPAPGLGGQEDGTAEAGRPC